MTRIESSADNLASSWNTTYLWSGISRFSITVAIAVKSDSCSAASRLSQRDRFKRSRARFTSFSTSQEAGATWLYQGQRVLSEWQLVHARANTSTTDRETSAPRSSGALARPVASCGRGWTRTDARSHIRSKPEVATLAPVLRFQRVGPGAP